MTVWQELPLASLLEPGRTISYGIVQPGEHQDGGVPIVRVNAVRAGHIDTADPLRVAPSVESQYERTRLRGGELLLTLVGTVGEAAEVPLELAGWNVARAIGVIPVDSEVGARWVRYAIGTQRVRNLIDAWCNTTVQKTLNLKDLARIPIALPPPRERAAIVDVLGALDDKIDLNRRMNQTLEAMAQAIFRSWFVDFDPVRAKAEGRQPEGMDAATAALFPAEFALSGNAEIPVGWRLGRLGDVVEVFDSKRVPLSGRERAQRQGPYPYYGAASAMDSVDGYIFDGIYVLVGEDGSVIDVRDRPVVQYVWGKFWVNNHAHVLRGCAPVCSEHILLALRETNIRAYVTGAVQPKLTQANLRQIPIVVASPEVCARFAALLEPLFARLRINDEECRTLAALRDTLLPKFFSGEIRIKDAEAAVAARV